MSADIAQPVQHERVGTTRVESRQHCLGANIGLVGDQKGALRFGNCDASKRPFVRAGVVKSRCRKQVDQCRNGSGGTRCDQRAGEGHRGGDDAVRRAARFAGSLGCREQRLSVQIDMRADHDIYECLIVCVRRSAQERQHDIRLDRPLRGVEHRYAMQTGDLRGAVHLRCTRRVLHVLTRCVHSDLAIEPRNLLPVRGHCFHDGHVECRWQGDAGVRLEPGL